VELTLTPAQRREVRKNFSEQGLTICCVATGLKFAMADAAERGRNAAKLREYIDLAGDLGAARVRIFGGARPDGNLCGIARYMAEAIRPTLTQAQQRGVTVVMETHDDWCHAVSVRAVVREVNHPHFTALWDIMHTQRYGETPAESFGMLGPHIQHLHVHDGKYSADGLKMDSCALGQGVIDHAGPLCLLKQAGFDGFASLEVILKSGEGGKSEEVLKDYAVGLQPLLG